MIPSSARPRDMERRAHFRLTVSNWGAVDCNFFCKRSNALVNIMNISSLDIWGLTATYALQRPIDSSIDGAGRPVYV